MVANTGPFLAGLEITVMIYTDETYQSDRSFRIRHNKNGFISARIIMNVYNQRHTCISEPEWLQIEFVFPHYFC